MSAPYLAAPARPRPVFCPIGHLHTSRAVADDACRGRFTENGTTLELGLEPDWRAGGLAHDEEWRISWTKFYFGLDLAHAYAETGEGRYARTWARLVRSFAEQVAADHDPSDVAARRITNWIYAWERLAGAPELAGLEQVLPESIAAQAAHVRATLTPERNHRTLELYALLLVALALPQLDAGGELRRFAVSALTENLLEDFRPDGVHRESSTHYHMVALRSFAAAGENLRRFGMPLPDGYRAAFSRACDFALHCRRPDGTIPALSDADSARYDELYALAGELLDRDDLRHAGSGGALGAPPRRRNVSFPDGGYHVQRGGARPERFLLFDCGPLGDGGHGHYDLLSVEIAAGRPLVVDPGRYTYSEAPPNLRRWFKGTAAHSTVTVDGRDQTPYRRGKPRGPVAEGRLLARLRAPGLDVLHGEACSPAYEALHRRRVVFVAEEYWLVEDVLAGAVPHRYDLRFQLGPQPRPLARARLGAVTLVRTEGAALLVHADAEARLEAGWVAPTYGTKVRAPVVRATAHGREARFLTLVAPLDGAAPAPEIAVRREGAATTVAVRGAGPEGAFADTVVLLDAPEPLVLGPLEGRGGAAWLRRSPEGAPLAGAWAGRNGRWRSWRAGAIAEGRAEELP